MENLSVLYVSGSLGLGHVTRDLAVAGELRKRIPGADIEWLAAEPARTFLKEAGERVIAEAEALGNDSVSAEEAARGTSLNLMKYLLKAKDEWKKNVEVFMKVVGRKKYDLVVGDETYEINIAMREHPEVKTFPYAVIYDFVGLEAMTLNPLERLGVYYWNRIWTKSYRLKQKPVYDLAFFVGEPEDVPDTRFGPGLPRRRDYAREIFTFIGYIFPFDPAEYADREQVREKLGYGVGPLVICSIGGTAIGRDMLELCGEAYEILKEKVPDLHFLVVTGPRLPRDAVHLPEGVEVRGFVPRLYEHFAVCDLAIVQGGGTTVFELTALRRPFLYFPLKGHCEQANIARILSRRGAGVQMDLSRTSPALLAEKIMENLGKEVTYPPIPVDGARKAAEALCELVNGRE